MRTQRFHPLPLESFARKQNLTPAQSRFDQAVSRLFPQGRIAGLPVVVLIPVPLAFSAPDDLAGFTDAAIAEVPSDGLFRADNLAWLTITPVPSSRWRARKLRRQTARWHSELRRMWLDAGRVCAGRRHGDDSRSWDVSKNPLQDPVSVREVALLPDQVVRSVGYGTLRCSHCQGRGVLSVDGDELAHFDLDDESRLEISGLDGLVGCGAVVLRNTSASTVQIGMVVRRAGQVVTARGFRDHLSATRHRQLVETVSSVFEFLADGGEPGHEWPELRVRSVDLAGLHKATVCTPGWVASPDDSLLYWLSDVRRSLDVERRPIRLVAPSAGVVRTSDQGLSLAVGDSARCDVLPLALPDGHIPFVQDSQFVEAGETLATVSPSVMSAALDARSDLSGWAAAVSWVVQGRMREQGHVPWSSVPPECPGLRRLVTLPESTGRIQTRHNELPAVVVSWPVWDEFYHTEGGVHWHLQPTDARFIRRT